MLFPFTSLNAPKCSPSGTLGNGGDHRHVDTDLSEPRIGENDVKAGTLVSRVPVRDLLFLSWLTADVSQPVVKRISNIIMPLSDTTADVALGGMPAPVVAVVDTADGAIGPSMMADARSPFDLLNAEATSEGSAKISVIHGRCPFFRDEESTRFRA